MTGMTAEQVAELVNWLRDDMEICRQHMNPENGNLLVKEHWSAMFQADADVLRKLVEMGVISDGELERVTESDQQTEGGERDV